MFAYSVTANGSVMHTQYTSTSKKIEYREKGQYF